MANIISLNGNSGIPQPATLKEELTQVMRDKVSINGTSRRVWLAQKKQATFTLTGITQAQYSTLVGYFYGGAQVTYANSQSGFTFTGYATVAEAEYWRGASFLRNMTVTILEA